MMELLYLKSDEVLISSKTAGCYQEDEEEVLLLGGVCKPKRSQGFTSCLSFLKPFFCHELLKIYN